MVCLASVAAEPKEVVDPRREYLVRSWSKEHGLADDRVVALLQTHDGYLWIASPYGLVRFDGITFAKFTRGTRADMPADDCRALAEDGDGNLWVGTSEGLLRWDGTRFTNLTVEKGWGKGPVISLAPSAAGGVWVSTSDGVQYGSPRSDRPEGVSKVAPVWMMAEGAGGTLWMASDNLLRRDPRTKESRAFPILERDGGWVAKCVWPMADDEVSVLAVTGGVKKACIASFRGDAWGKVIPIPWGEAFFSRNAWMVRDRKGRVWVPNGSRGLLRLQEGKWQPVGPPWMANEDFALCAMEDREGNLWIGTEQSGLHCLTPKRLVSISSADGLAHDQVRSVWPALEGGIWAATDKGVSRVSPRGVVVTNWTAIGEWVLEKTKVVAESPGRVLWIGRAVDHLGFANGVVERHRYPRPPNEPPGDESGTGFNKVRCFLPARDGSLWIGVPRGLHRVAGKEDRFYTTADGLGADDVRALVETRDGTVWVGTAGGGLSRFTRDPSKPFVTLRRADGLSRDTVWALHEDSAGALWAGTDGGLNRILNGTIATFDSRQGLPADGVNVVVEDDFGALWIGHDRGLYRVKRADLDAVAMGRTKRAHGVPFGVADGMAVAECNGQTATPAACRTADGRLWFATPKGIVLVDPKSLQQDEVPPAVVIEKVIADETVLRGDESAPGIGVGQGAPIRIGPGHARYLEFRYTANTFVASEAARFRVRLEGYEDTWHDVGNRRLVQYVGLPPGRYRFHVTAGNHHDVWNETEATLPFELEPYLYQTVGFWLGTGSLVAVALAGLARWRFQTVRRKARAHERTLLARTLHDHLGADLASFQSLAELARRAIPPDHPANEHLQRLSAATGRAGRTLRDAIFTVGPGEATLVGLCARITQFAGDLLARPGFDAGSTGRCPCPRSISTRTRRSNSTWPRRKPSRTLPDMRAPAPAPSRGRILTLPPLRGQTIAPPSGDCDGLRSKPPSSSSRWPSRIAPAS